MQLLNQRVRYLPISRKTLGQLEGSNCFPGSRVQLTRGEAAIEKPHSQEHALSFSQLVLCLLIPSSRFLSGLLLRPSQGSLFDTLLLH